MATFNPAASFSQGVGLAGQIQDRQRQNQVNALQGQVGQQIQQGGFNPSTSLDFQQLSLIDPAGARVTAQTFDELDSTRKKAYFQDMRQGRKLLEKGDNQGFLDLFSSRLNDIETLQGDTQGTKMVLDKFLSGDVQGVISGLRSAEDAGVEMGMLTDPLDRKLKEATITQRESGKSVKQREFESLTSGLTEEQKKEATLIQLGLSPRAVGNAIQTITSKGIEEQIGNAKAIIKGREKFAEMTATSRAKAIDSGFEKITKIDAGLRNIDRAVAELNAGAGVGAIEKFLPSFRASSVALDNIQKSMALDVIGSVTFGALSQGELDLAKEVALPTGLDTPQLIKYLGDRKAAQEKLRGYYQEQIDFLDQGGSVAGFMRSKERGAGQQPQQEQAQPSSVGRFTIEVQ